jgi:hypothetical protein
MVPHTNQNFVLKLLQQLRRCFPPGQPYPRGRTVLEIGWVHHDAMGPDRWTVGEELVKKRMLSQGSTDIEWFFRALWAMKRELCFRFARRQPPPARQCIAPGYQGDRPYAVTPEVASNLRPPRSAALSATDPHPAFGHPLPWGEAWEL